MRIAFNSESSHNGKFWLLPVVIGLLISCSEKYQSTPFIQDYAEKYELNSEEPKPELYGVRCDRNKTINVFSEEGLLRPGDKYLVKDRVTQARGI